MIAVTLAAPNRSEVALVPLDVSSRCIQACSVNVFDESWRAEDGGAGSSNRYPVTHATLFRRCGACKRCEALCDAPDFTHRLASVPGVRLAKLAVGERDGTVWEEEAGRAGDVCGAGPVVTRCRHVDISCHTAAAERSAMSLSRLEIVPDAALRVQVQVWRHAEPISRRASERI